MITPKLMAAACALALSAVPAFAGGMDKGHKDPGMRSMQAPTWQFGELDANRDNKITKQELTEKGVTLADFEQADSDQDGALDQEEFAAIIEE